MGKSCNNLNKNTLYKIRPGPAQIGKPEVGQLRIDFASEANICEKQSNFP